MFLARDNRAIRENLVRSFQHKYPGIAVVLGAVNFEWTLCRAILFLKSKESSNLDVREKLRKSRGLDGYKSLWKAESVWASDRKALTEVVVNWSDVRDAFDVRNKLVHGQDRFTWKMAKPQIDALLEGVVHIDNYCNSLGISLQALMPIRRRKRA